MSHPYSDLEDRSFWKTAVGVRNCLEVNELWSPKFALDKNDKVLTAGSCFAQHIGRALRKNGYNWFIAEPGPEPQSEQDKIVNQRYGYDIFSFRTANIYTAALLRQWLQWAVAPDSQSDEVWEQNGRFFDPVRPGIEPGGFETLEELRAARMATLDKIHNGIADAQVFVFTLGLTEAWYNERTGLVYAMCPGTMAGKFDGEQHKFLNFRHSEIMVHMEAVLTLARQINPKIRFLLTVSPVPLTATASADHVVCATMYSKSTLRSVAQELRDGHDFVDYFPSFEVISSPVFKGMFFQPNQREVALSGVEHVMKQFFEGQSKLAPDVPTSIGRQASNPTIASSAPSEAAPEPSAEDIHCEDAMLEAFSK